MPTISNSLTAAWALLLLLIGVTPVVAQKYTPEPPPLTTEPCKPTKKNPCPPPPASTTPPPASAFPFPGEDQPSTPGAAKPASATPTENAFPFPGEPAPDLPGAPASSSTSSSSEPDPAADPDKPALKDEGTTGSTRFARRKLPKISAVDPDEREAKDIEISRYYFSTGNFEAAYLRAKDATTTIPDDPAGHLALADAAARLKKSDEAVAEYGACLKLDSSDQQLKAAKKGLAELAAAKPIKQAAK